MTGDAPTLVDRIVAIAAALDSAGLPWAFGGALALAYATEEPRATRDIDVNVFVPATDAAAIYDALPEGVRHDDADIDTARRDDQVRLWWDDTPVDVFFAADTFHDEVAMRCRRVPFAGATISILAAEDLAVFKALFDRPKDWVDITTMAESQALDVERAADRLADLLGDDDRVQRLRSIP
ncbi:MAG: DUF6036 family nucleotidyltransferase [Acidimicrobiales bacterium]